MAFPEFLTQYSLPADPYELRELNPLTNRQDENLLKDIAGSVSAYSDLLRLDRYLEDNSSANEPLFLLVKGADGCGRSSVANWLMARYCFHRGIKPQNFLVPQKTFDSNDSFGVLKDWLGLLIDDIDERGIQGPDINAFWAKRDQAKAGPPDDLIPWRSLARNIASQLGAVADGPYGYGVCLEDIRVPKVVESALTVFAKARTVCVFTVGDYGGDKKKVISFYEEYKEPIKKEGVRVGPLTGADVRELLRERWEFTTSKTLQSPFPSDTDLAFADQNRPVKRVMVLINKLLRLKSTDFSAKRWPNDSELAFQRDELERKIKILDAEV